MFDHRGSGMSDGFETPPSLEDRTRDIEAVLDAAGVETTNLSGYDFGGQLAIGFSAWKPDRVDRLALMNSRVGYSGDAKAEELNPGIEIDQSSTVAVRLEQVRTEVGVESAESRWLGNSPSAVKHPDYLEGGVAYERSVGSRDVWRKQIESVAEIDIVEIAPLVRAKTLITNNHNRVHHVGKARLLNELIPNSNLIEFEGEDMEWWLADNWTEIVDTHVEFLTGSAPQIPTTRRFGVVMFTDLVASTSSSLSLGDVEWKQRLDTYERTATNIVNDN
jgi:pimeloyl-ACP methyl ester carboxylesterase